MSLHVGIDFGTSNSGVAVYDGQVVRLLPLDPDNVIPEVLKTILYVTRDGQHTIGQEAIELYYRQNVGRQRRYVRQWTGEIEYRGADMFYVRDIYTEVDELAPGRLLQLIKTALRAERYQGTQIFERYYTVADLIAAYLGELKRRAEAYLGESLTRATIGRPVQFSPDPQLDQRAQQILRQAAEQAGFRQVHFELEPVAAALDYERQLEKPQVALIFDFGGGTLDLTIMRLGDRHERRIFANGGIGIAGSDFDRAIIQGRLLPHFGQGLTRLPPEVSELVAAVADWTALPDLSTPLARGHLGRAIRARLVPVRLRALQALIFNDLAFTFYNAVEAAKIELSRQGATVIRLQEKDLDLW
ncbi:MAG: Hsp70 family protein, partial [Anaerolineales bacterium]|nr:Hsp70 family protein [Anaerolineales bacterium]